MAEIKNVAEALEVIATLNSQIDEQKETIAQQAETIDELRAELAKSNKAAKASKVTVKHEGSTYEIVIGKFNYKGEPHTAETLAKNPELIAELIKEESGVLVKVK